MKKARLMLSAIAIFATVGTALAIKVNKSTHFIYTGTLHSGVCTVKTDGHCIGNGIVNIAASTQPLYSGCPDVYMFVCGD